MRETIQVDPNCRESLKAAADKLQVSIESIKEAFRKFGEQMAIIGNHCVSGIRQVEELTEELLAAKQQQDVVVEQRMDWVVLLVAGRQPAIPRRKPMRLASSYG